jgi:hypothetical protein
MTEIIHTESDAKAALYAAMRRGTDPRWGAEPVELPKQQPRTPLWLWLIAVPLTGVALISIARGVF